MDSHEQPPLFHPGTFETTRDELQEPVAEPEVEPKLRETNHLERHPKIGQRQEPIGNEDWQDNLIRDQAPPHIVESMRDPPLGPRKQPSPETIEEFHRAKKRIDELRNGTSDPA